MDFMVAVAGLKGLAIPAAQLSMSLEALLLYMLYLYASTASQLLDPLDSFEYLEFLESLPKSILPVKS